ncbi:MAG: SufE family protein [Rhizobiaceae bacterium]|nr:SufE family protein [Rhizobiaceae bacterium]
MKCEQDSHMNIEDIIDNFEFLDEWEDRYKYLIELGNQLEPFPEAHRLDANKVQGCVSQVWVITKTENGDNPVITILGDSDAHIVRGLVAIALAIFSGKPASEILAIDEGALFDRIGLSEHITPQRSNGLRSLVARIKSDAQAALAN